MWLGRTRVVSKSQEPNIFSAAQVLLDWLICGSVLEPNFLNGLEVVHLWSSCCIVVVHNWSTSGLPHTSGNKMILGGYYPLEGRYFRQIGLALGKLSCNVQLIFLSYSLFFWEQFFDFPLFFISETSLPDTCWKLLSNHSHFWRWIYS